jgi:serine/threonine protein kinase
VPAEKLERTGQVLDDRFRIDQVIGRGAMAEVYRALDLATQAYVAVKIMRHAALADPVSRSRFAREAEVQARLRHRNVAALLATGATKHDEPYLVVELLRGTSLRTVIKHEHRVAPARAASYAWQALQGLAHVHAGGILHRDLKPANIMLEASPGPIDRVVLIDFGFATFEGSAKLTATGTVVGSLTYMAPDRLRGEPVDQRSDIYAMGIILFELLAGRPPFVAGDDFELIDMHRHVAPPRLREVDAALPQSLDDVISRALEKQQRDRYATAVEMAQALERAALTL